MSLPVVQRLLGGKLHAPRFTSVIAVAQALGLNGLRILEDGSIKFDPSLPAQDFRQQQAWKKARKLVQMVQATSALLRARLLASKPIKRWLSVPTTNYLRAPIIGSGVTSVRVDSR